MALTQVPPALLSSTTGTGSTVVLSASPTLTGTVVAPTINAGAATALTLQSASTTALTIDTSQNVGIGTSSPLKKLSVVVSGTAITDVDSADSYIESPNRAITANSGTFGLYSNDTVAADLGGSLVFGGKYSSNNAANFAKIKGGLVGSYGGYLSFGTRPDFGNMTERMRIDSSGNLLFNSGYGSVATAYGCRAWVNFNGGNGNTAGVINGSGNVSSITVNGTGDYTINFTNAMPDANYTVFGGKKPPSGATSTNGKVLYVKWDTAPTTTAVRVVTNSTGGAENQQYCYVSIFR
jgi:hypothetical protein